MCFAIFAIFFSGLGQYNSSAQLPIAKESENPLRQSYSNITISTDPLLIYISDFLSQPEIEHILNITDNRFVPSRVYSSDSLSYRSSSSCVLPASDPTYDNLIARSKLFLDKVLEAYPATGLSYFDFEPLQLVRYGPSEYYNAHVDWFDVLHREAKGWSSRLYNRGASFFIYLDDDCVGGGTDFPEINANFIPSQNAALESLISTDGKGISFVPKKGNGLFWVNLKPDGMGDERLVHAGLPVKQGRKVGMNIWVKRDFGW